MGKRSVGRGAVGCGARVVLPLVLLLVLTVAEPPRALAGGQPPAEVVAGVTAAYGTGGTLAVVVARQQLSADPDLPPRAAEARARRVTAGSADNGQIAQQPFPSASMVKLFLAEDVLHRARARTVPVTQGDLDLLARMIISSDDPAASAIWVRFGGAQAVRDVAARYDLTGTTPPQRPGQWGETMTTARDLARFLTLLPVVAHPDDAALLTSWMSAATPIAADGFNQQFGLLGVVAGAAVKQGWMCCVRGQRHLHSVGVVGTRVVVMLSEVPGRVGYDEARAWLTTAATAVPPAPG